MKKFLFLLSLFLFIVTPCFGQQNAQNENPMAKLYSQLINVGIILAAGAIVFGGIKFIISIGEPAHITEAKEWLGAGFIGLLLVLSAKFLYTGMTGLTKLPWEQNFFDLPKKEVTPEEIVGVYFCQETEDGNCEKCAGPFKRGLSSAAIHIGPRVGSIKVINFPKKGFNFAFILFPDLNFQAIKTLKTPIDNMGIFPAVTSSKEEDEETGKVEQCFYNIPLLKEVVGSIAIFNKATEEEMEKFTFGAGVWFYQGFAFTSGAHRISDDEVKRIAGQWMDLDTRRMNYHDVVDADKNIETLCKFAYNKKKGAWCLQSIRILGNYGVLLSSPVVREGFWASGKRSYQFLLGSAKSETNLQAYRMWDDAVSYEDDIGYKPYEVLIILYKP